MFTFGLPELFIILWTLIPIAFLIWFVVKFFKIQNEKIRILREIRDTLKNKT